jgi:hypothetical protein
MGGLHASAAALRKACLLPASRLRSAEEDEEDVEKEAAAMRAPRLLLAVVAASTAAASTPCEEAALVCNARRAVAADATPYDGNKKRGARMEGGA